MPDHNGERTEKATLKRRKDARKKGNVARSLEVNSALVLLTATSVIALTFDYFFGNIRGMMSDVFSQLFSYQISVDSISHFALLGFLFLMKLLAPLFISILLIGAAGNVLQFGFLITGVPLKPDLNNISPLTGLKRIFSIKSAAELAKALLKISVIGSVIFVTISGALKNFTPLVDQSPTQIAAFFGNTMLSVAFRAAIALMILALLDYCFIRWEHEKSLRMTKLEVKEELKEHEGNPLFKSRIRTVQRDISFRRMMSKLPEADVIITNPEHYAIAIRYVSGEMNAPVVIAKGAKKIAEKIKTSAVKKNIPIIENRQLAKSLFKTCELGSETPAQLYKGVAEILADVYRLRQMDTNESTK